MIPCKSDWPRLSLSSIVLIAVLPGCGVSDEATQSSTERRPLPTASQTDDLAAPSNNQISELAVNPVEDAETRNSTERPMDIAADGSSENSSDESDGESRTDSSTSKTELLASQVEQSKPVVTREKLLGEAREAYESDRKQIDGKWSKAEAELLTRWDVSLIQARKSSLEAAVNEAEAALESWKERIDPLLLNDNGKVFAQKEHSVIAFLRQTEFAALPKLMSQIESARKLLKRLEAFPGDDRGNSLLEGADSEKEKLRVATSSCTRASDTILGYMLEAQKEPATPQAAPVASLPTLQAVIDRFIEQELSTATGKLAQAGFVGQLSAADKERFAQAMQPELAKLEMAAATLRAWPKSFWGTGGHYTAQRIVLIVDSPMGHKFTGRLLFANKGSDDRFGIGYEIQGFVRDKTLRFTITELMKGSPEAAARYRGFIFDGVIGANTINGDFYVPFGKDGSKTIYDKFSFDPSRPYTKKK